MKKKFMEYLKKNIQRKNKERHIYLVKKFINYFPFLWKGVRG
jgi:hypothetical protein